ncbi:MAG: hypothetical protein M1823_000356 [Watsoniomyces obsoletus]|nr:MAG: hypothetical protein M1823_000356 [Watsoniomyces obsoletus]
MHSLQYLFLSALSLTPTVFASSAVLDLLPSNFDDIVLKSGKPALVEFFAPWCGHCKTLAPIYEELAQNFEHAGDKISIAKVDADEHRSLGKRFGVQGFPTLKWFDGKSDQPEEYNSGRDIDSLMKFITDKTGLKAKTKAQEPSLVEMLNDTTFKQKVGGEQHVLLAFTAPWCGHCKSLAPVWESLANDFASESSVIIAKVDAEAPNAKATAQDQGVSAYPTIKYFPAGSKEAETYSGGRSEKDLVKFVNEKAGTHRQVGGSLDDEAGLIPSLDSVISKVTQGEAVEKITKEVQDALKEIKDKSGEYYLKVLAKVKTNEGYVEKELARITGLLKKGSGLAKEKKDDLVIRRNILGKFMSRKAEDIKKDEL